MKISNFISKNIVSIDLGSYETKVVEGKMTNKGIVINKYFSFLTPEGSYEDGHIIDSELIYYVFKEELKKHNISSDKAYVNIKSSSIITREVTLPLVGGEDLKGILTFQLDEYLPIDIEDYIIQYRFINKVEEEGVMKQNILLIAVSKEIIEAHLELLKNMELKPKVLDLQSNSINKLLRYNSLVNRQYSTNEVTFATVDLGFYNTNVTITKNASLKLSRTVKKGNKDINQNILNFFEYTKDDLEEIKRNIIDVNRFTDDDSEYNSLVNIIKSSLEEIVNKIELIFKYYNSRNMKNNIQMILLCGGLSNLGGIENFFSNYFAIPTVKLNSMDKVFWNGDLSKYVNCISGIIRCKKE